MVRKPRDPVYMVVVRVKREMVEVYGPYMTIDGARDSIPDHLEEVGTNFYTDMDEEFGPEYQIHQEILRK